MMDTRTIRHLFAATAAFANVLFPVYGISSVSTGDEAAIRVEEVASLQTMFQPAEHMNDLAIVSIKASSKVTLSSKKPTVVKTVKLAIRNRSPFIETIPDQNILIRMRAMACRTRTRYTDSQKAWMRDYRQKGVPHSGE